MSRETMMNSLNRGLLNIRSLTMPFSYVSRRINAALLWRGLALLAMLSLVFLLSDGMPDAAAQTEEPLTISVDDVSAVEGDLILFTVRLNRPAPHNITFGYKIVAGTATPNVDYDYTPPTAPFDYYSTWFREGSTEETSHAIYLYEDDVTEGPETFRLVITRAADGVSIIDDEGVATINDPAKVEPQEEQVDLAILADGSVTEGEDATFYLAHPRMSTPISASVTVSQSGDFAAGGQLGARSVTTRTGDTQTSFTVATQNDNRDESNGSITVTLNQTPDYNVQRGYGTASITVLDDDEPAISITPGSSIRESETAVFELTADPPPAANLQVNVNVSESGAFTASGQTGSRTVTIGTNGRGTLNVATEADTVDEDDGTITATLASGQGYSVVSGRSSASVIVTDGGTPTPRISISAGSAIDEGDSATFDLTASPKPASNLDVVVEVGESGDFAASGQTGSRTVTVGTDGSASFSVATQDDDAVEDDGSITVTVLGGAGYSVAHPASVSVRVRDVGTTKPFISISARRAIIEGDTAVFTLKANPPPTTTTSVDVEVAQRGDFVASGQTGIRSVDVSSDGTGSFSVSTDDDELDERSGTITATLQSGADYAIGSPSQATVRVSDNDVEADDRTIVVADAELAENSRESSSMRFKVTMNQRADQLVMVTYELRETTNAFGNATEDVDYWGRDGYVLFRPGDTVKYAHVLLFNDSEHEEEETFELVLTEVIGPAEIANGVATGTILPDPHDAPRATPVFTITADAAVIEGEPFAFTLTAEPPPKDDMTVNITISDAGGSDFLADNDEGARTVTFYGDASLAPASEQTYTIETISDNADEENGAVSVAIADPDQDGDYIVGTPHSAGITVYDDDGAPAELPQIAVTDAVGTESAGTIWFSVTVAPPVPAQGTIRVYYSLHPGTARDGEDYVRRFGYLTFQGGEAHQYVQVPIIDDNEQEGAEAFRLRLSFPEGATLADEVGVGTIEESD